MLTLTIYAGLSTTKRPYNDDLAQARLGAFTTIFGGLYGTFDFFLPTSPARNYTWTGGDRVVLRDGLTIVWEGIIANIYKSIRDSERGLDFACIGAQSRLEHLYIDRRWADTRTSADVWEPSTNFHLVSNSQDYIGITPPSGEYRESYYISASYNMPEGRTVKRVAYSYIFSTEVTATANKAFDNSLTDLSNAVDGNVGTSSTITLNAGQYLYIGSREEFDFVDLTIGTVNANTATISGQYVAAQTHTWTALSGLSDGTATGGKTLAQDGRISFTRPPGWATDGLVAGSRMFWIRLTPSANLTANITLEEIEIGRAGDWLLRLQNTIIDSEVSVTGSGSDDATITSPNRNIQLRMHADSRQSLINNGTLMVQVRDIVVYDDTTAPTTYKVLVDLVGEASGVLNSDVSQISPNSLDLTPFITVGPEAIISILDRVIGYSDSLVYPWYWTLLHSERATTPNGKPVLKATQVPQPTDYEYLIAIGEETLLPPFELFVDYEAIINYVTVIYENEFGYEAIMTPESEAQLKDVDSIAAYGERHGEPLRIGLASEGGALNFGRRFLAQRKDPQYSVSGPIRITGGIRLKGGGWLPAAQIHADGTRVKIENFIDDVAAADGSGLTFRIAATSYDPATGICDISTGQYDDLSVMLARLQS